MCFRRKDGEIVKVEDLSAMDHFKLLYEIVGRDKTHPDAVAWRSVPGGPGKKECGVALLHKHHCYEAEVVSGFFNTLRPVLNKPADSETQIETQATDT